MKEHGVSPPRNMIQPVYNSRLDGLDGWVHVAGHPHRRPVLWCSGALVLEGGCSREDLRLALVVSVLEVRVGFATHQDDGRRPLGLRRRAKLLLGGHVDVPGEKRGRRGRVKEASLLGGEWEGRRRPVAAVVDEVE